jgi:hypothetical protein
MPGKPQKTDRLLPKTAGACPRLTRITWVEENRAISGERQALEWEYAPFFGFTGIFAYIPYCFQAISTASQ